MSGNVTIPAVRARSRRGENAAPDTTDSEAASIVKSVRRIVRAVDLRSKEVSRAVGLTIPQLVTLRAIEALGDVTVNALSAYVDLSAATVVTILANLEERGLVDRVRSRIDRRVVFTRLTPRGRRILRIAPPLLHDRFLEGFRRVGRRRQRELAAAFGEIADLLSR